MAQTRCNTTAVELYSEIRGKMCNLREELRPKQEEILELLLAKEHVLGIIPTVHRRAVAITDSFGGAAIWFTLDLI